jgi:hypothetical protein
MFVLHRIYNLNAPSATDFAEKFAKDVLRGLKKSSFGCILESGLPEFLLIPAVFLCAEFIAQT